MRTNKNNKLRGKGGAEKLGLYIHVPFCASKCRYCDFYSLAGQQNRMGEYIKAVTAHIREYSSLCRTHTVDTVYFGGGTPSFLGEKHLSSLLNEIAKQFALASGTEITVECNPDSMNPNLLRRLQKAGVNRLSIGLQSTDDDELRMLGRIHTAMQACDAVKLAQDTGFSNIGLDLMYGLPHQTKARFLQSVRDALALGPTHLSCYGLKLEPGTPMAAQKPSLPDDDTQADIYLALCELLRHADFEHYEISNWAKQGYRSRHNSKYWDLSEYLGLGPAAHSYLGDRRFAFVSDLESYCHDDDILADEEEVPTIERHGEYLMLRLRTSDGVIEHEFEKRFGRDFDPYAAKLEPMIAHGLAEREIDRWYLTEKGFLVSNAIIGDVLSADDPTLADEMRTNPSGLLVSY